MIIDENVFHCFVNSSGNWQIVRDSLKGSRNASLENHKMHYGGTYYRTAVQGCSAMKNLFLVLSRGSRVVVADDAEVDAAERKWKTATNLQCDTDHWALGLAEVANTRLLVSNDKGLKSDFKNMLSPGGRTICDGTLKKADHLVRVLRSVK